MKVALFAFVGEPMCFVHVLLNAIDLTDRGHEAKIIIEGSATKLVKEFHDNPEMPFANLYEKAKTSGLIEGVCKACAAKMGSKDSAEAQELALLGDMNGHPSVAKYLEEGYQVLTF